MLNAQAISLYLFLWRKFHLSYNNSIMDTVEINKYAKFDPDIPCGSWVMSIFINWPQPAEMMLSKPSSIKKTVTHASDNVDMYFYAKLDQNKPCGSRVMSIFTNW